ncbi:MAG TPA: 3-isopropylmalate dehydrogenase [Longimicrobiales bacterium]
MRARITLLPGDGIGPEVTAEAARVLRAVAERGGHAFALDEAPIGGCAVDAAGTPLPQETLGRCRDADAVLFGAVGGPRWDDAPAALRPERGLLELRRALGAFANLRPITVHPRLAAASPLRPERLAGVDFVVVRELTGGIYFGDKRRDPLPGGGEHASDVCGYTTAEVERIARVAARLARERRGRLTSVDKANVLETSRLWRETVSRVVADEFPDVALEHLLVDACAMHLLQRPSDFDVIVTENMFGDILTDEASVLAGSIGVLPSASLGEPAPGKRKPVGLYEPIHGSAPELAGRGVANPIGAVRSAALLLRHSLGLEAEADAVEAAVDHVLEHGPWTADLAGQVGVPGTGALAGEAGAAGTDAAAGPATTRAVGDAILAVLDAAPIADRFRHRSRQRSSASATAPGPNPGPASARAPSGRRR